MIMERKTRLTYRERKELEREENEEYTNKILKRSVLALLLFTLPYLGLSVTKGLGEVENQRIAKKKGSPVIEQSYLNYVSLGIQKIIRDSGGKYIVEGINKLKEKANSLADTTKQGLEGAIYEITHTK